MMQGECEKAKTVLRIGQVDVYDLGTGKKRTKNYCFQCNVYSELWRTAVNERASTHLRDL